MFNLSGEDECIWTRPIRSIVLHRMHEDALDTASCAE